MNRYPLWKNILIGLVLLTGLIYTLPNFFGEAPAVQVSPLKSTVKADTALAQQIEAALRAAAIPFEQIAVEANGIRVRFNQTETQIKAKDILQAQLGNRYVVALNLVSRSPEWLTKIHALPMYLGLDLRGGVHFMLQVDMRAALAKSLDRASGDIRRAMRDKRIPYSGVSRDGERIVVKFKSADARSRADLTIRDAASDLTLNAQETGGDYLLVASLSQPAKTRIQEFALQQNITTLRNRINELGVQEPIVQQQGIDRVVVQLPGVQDTAKAKEILGRTATLEIRMVDEQGDLASAAQGNVPFGDEYYVERNGAPLLVKKNVVLTGDYITDASPGINNQTGESVVHLTLNGVGGRIFGDVTRENVGKRMAILLIEKGSTEVVTAPVIRDEISGGRVEISGMDNPQEATDVALLLRAGALAAPMEIIEERTVGPSLGAENVAKGFHATLVGFALISAFMIIYYNVFGIISILALAANLLLLVGILSMLQATLTLPGMAGIALTLGMAIDANVLINERIREELRNGNSPQAAIQAGYERAFGTIFDSNITTLIAGIALFSFGTGPVKGFAVVLCLGILTSMFSAVMVSRALVNLFYGSRRKIEKLSIGQIWAPATAK